MREGFVKALLEWYYSHKRDLPWRHTSDPYKIWISEIMLQQTRVQAVIQYYLAFTRELPDIKSLASCEEQKLLKLWEGLGYYNRARNLQKAACEIENRFGGHFPERIEDIRSLPGIGRYTAGAVGSIAFGLPEPAVDGNVLRVWARLTSYEENILTEKAKSAAESFVKNLLDNTSPDGCAFKPGDLNQALIELGAVVCLPAGEPKCEECPLSSVCLGYKHGTWEKLPLRIKKNSRRIEDLTVLIVRCGNKTAILKRSSGGLLKGLYGFPTVEGHVSAEEAVAFVSAKGYDALHVRPLKSAVHIFSHIEWHMTGYEIRVSDFSSDGGPWHFAGFEELQNETPVASAFAPYAETINLMLGKRGKRKSL